MGESCDEVKWIECLFVCLFVCLCVDGRESGSMRVRNRGDF